MRYFTNDQVERLIPPGTQSACLVASYSPRAGICPNLVHYTHELSNHFDRVVLLTNKRPLPNASSLPPTCVVACVPNQCLDFGMWARVLHNLNSTGLRRLGLVNDSCYIVRPLDGAFATAQHHGWEFWGMCYSEEQAPHVQSFFVVAEGGAVARMLDFFKGGRFDGCASLSKDEIVRRYEVGLSRHMSSAHSIHGVYSMDMVLRRWPERPVPPNAPTFYWDCLLELGCPLLKKTRYGGYGDAGHDVVVWLAVCGIVALVCVQILF